MSVLSEGIDVPKPVNSEKGDRSSRLTRKEIAFCQLRDPPARFRFET